MLRERDINDFLNGRQFFILTAVLFVACAFFTSFTGEEPIHGNSTGACFSSASVLGLPSFVSTLLNVGVMTGICLLMSLLNKVYSFIREITYVYASTFLLLGIAEPQMSAHLYDGSIFGLVTAALTLLLFGLYQHPHPQRRIFLISAILSACCLFRYAFIYLIPIFFIGFLQMRAMNLRSALAMIFGLVTPFWVLVGTGLVNINEFQPPLWENVWNHDNLSQSLFTIITVATTSLLTLILLTANVLHIINYKMQVRAYNGFFLILALGTMIVIAVDYSNVYMYLPVLFICLSIQMAHTFTIGKNLHRYIPYLLFAAVCLGLFAWHITC